MATKEGWVWYELTAGMITYRLYYVAERPSNTGTRVNVTFTLYTFRNSQNFFGYPIQNTGMWCNGSNYAIGQIKGWTGTTDFGTIVNTIGPIAVDTKSNYVNGVRLIMDSAENRADGGTSAVYDTYPDVSIEVPPIYWWNNVNVLNPQGVEDGDSGTFYLYTSENNSSRGPMYDQDSDMTHASTTYFDVYNISPAKSYYELDYVAGHDSVPSTGRYRSYFSEGRVVSIKMRYKSFDLDLNGRLDGTDSGNLGAYGKVDVYINGTKVASQVNDFCTNYVYGTTYEIKNIQANPGYTYVGVVSGSLSGTISASTHVRLAFVSNSLNVKVSGAWKKGDVAYVKVSNTWKQGTEVYYKVSNTWKRIQ